MRLLLALTPLMVIAGAAFALPQDASQPIHIQANVAEMNQTTDEIVYQGDVTVDQGTLRVAADRITVHYIDQKVVRIVAEGSPARYRQEIEDPPGEVEAEATTIVYLTREEQLELSGSAGLRQQGNQISGESIRYDMVAGKVEAVSGAGGNVRMVLQPAARPPQRPQP